MTNNIQRQLNENILKKFHSGKVIVIIGPRQVGKTTLINTLLEGKDTVFIDGDDINDRNLMNNASTQLLRDLIGNKSCIFIDECQRIKNVGLAAKIIVDQIKNTQVILSGSSSFEINDEIKEPLTGRKWTFELFPISYNEWENHVGIKEAMHSLPHRMIFGFYPDIINNKQDESELLLELVDSYLFKDVLLYGNIKKADVIIKLTQALSYQIGSEVNYNEIAQLIGIDPKTVAYYIDVLEKAYVIFKLPSFSNNNRNEIKKRSKIYFYDNGIRNALIQNFSPLQNRNDVGFLWENFLISERIKQNRYYKRLPKSYYWRTTQQQEIDYVEADKDSISAFEFKWNPLKKGKFSTTFTEKYQSINEVINRDNYRKFIT